MTDADFYLKVLETTASVPCRNTAALKLLDLQDQRLPGAIRALLKDIPGHHRSTLLYVLTQLPEPHLTQVEMIDLLTSSSYEARCELYNLFLDRKIAPSPPEDVEKLIFETRTALRDMGRFLQEIARGRDFLK